MNTSEINNALQDLIIRLQDAEKGYKEIIRASSNQALNKWLDRYATERHNMHKALERHVHKLGGEPEVKTSILGDLHRLFIDIKINNVSHNSEFDAIVTEIERGSSTLISDYEKVLSEVKMPADIISTLSAQKTTVESELNALIQLKKEFNAEMA